MDDGYDEDNGIYIPNAFFVFQAAVFKNELRNTLIDIITNNIVMKNLHITDKTAMTPWKINLYHAAEFEAYIHKESSEYFEKLRALNGKEYFKPQNIRCFSSNDITVSRGNAQQLLMKNPGTKGVLERAESLQLNYILHCEYNDDSFTRVKYTDDIKAYTALTDIVSRLHDMTKFGKIIGWDHSFYTYKDNDELRIVSYGTVPQTT